MPRSAQPAPRHPNVFHDLRGFAALSRPTGCQHLRRKAKWPVFKDLLIDWGLICMAAWAVARWGWWLAPPAVVIVANRQRALGNLLHDAGHRNLCSDPKGNDAIAWLLLAPVLLVDLSHYRRLHARHHGCLGQPDRDPDLRQRFAPKQTWQRTYWTIATCPNIWLGNFSGHLRRLWQRPWVGAYFMSWWIALCSVLSMAGGMALTFLALWWVAKGTLFHLITVFREMCDHYGLPPDTVVTYTRDVPAGSVWSLLFHPHNNGYHLTHHLDPSIPYHQLPRAQAEFLRNTSYATGSTCCDGHFGGQCPVTTGWAQQ
jgi:fatty acid desaturase